MSITSLCKMNMLKMSRTNEMENEYSLERVNKAKELLVWKGNEMASGKSYLGTKGQAQIILSEQTYKLTHL